MHSAMSGNMFSSSVAELRNDNGERMIILPLNLIALIVTHLDDPADLARVCRTCRVLHYMTVPQLYEKVTLRSYAQIRYFNGRAEGHGGASPFAMGLNALVTRNVAGLVRSFKVVGEVSENNVKEFAKSGRIPDGTMFLNMSIRAAIDRMEKLEAVNWELGTKPLLNLYQGLSLRPKLTSLTLKFPTSRVPRPVSVIPPIPSLRSLKVLNIDPLCYPDDISLLLLGSKKLRELRLHWSPRMRNEAEPSVQLHSYFGRCINANYALPLRHLSIANLYAHNNGEFDRAFDPKLMESITAINSPGAENGAGNNLTAFVDQGWGMKDVIPALKYVRCDQVSQLGVDSLTLVKGLREFYIISSKASPSSSAGGSIETSPSNLSSTIGGTSTPDMTPPSCLETPELSLQTAFLDALCQHHGPSVRCLLLSNRWMLDKDELGRLVHGCPNLEQLGLSIRSDVYEILRLLLPFLPHLYAIRILEAPHGSELTKYALETSNIPFEEKLGREMVKPTYKNLRWVGIGDLLFHCGPSVQLSETGPRGQPVYKRLVRRVPPEAAKHVQIWGLDSLEI
ncbi:hypothetical protein L228DRAFT_235936 [Xylona heveae TC161]|uniref:F-box domain-containing protein n=1 Tax=Xylona heveae (strain CBS 132557 / TC161) TaxID=1328760 RepID=A0A165K361_XYLHT|nr:hypothetical protein L228DRAFT_235936 [Xylona heveae TC161]KZF26932.1 hypothetical protein L228DRAFT_235936 [Xylona heveae TC161]